MNEELINQIVSRILSEPAFQELLHGNKDGQHKEQALKPDCLVLLNYVPDFEQVLTTVQKCYGSDYNLNILPSDQAFVAKPTLPEGMTWITPQETLEKTTWQKIIIPACSANTLAKAALGIRDNPISELIGRGITQGIPTLLVTEYLGFTAQTPKAYLQLYEGYLQTVQTYGVVVNANLGEGCTSNLKMDVGSTDDRAEIRFDNKFLGDKQVYGIPEGAKVLVKKRTVISPLALDTLKNRRIELCVEREDERQ